MLLKSIFWAYQGPIYQGHLLWHFCSVFGSNPEPSAEEAAFVRMTSSSGHKKTSWKQHSHLCDCKTAVTVMEMYQMPINDIAKKNVKRCQEGSWSRCCEECLSIFSCCTLQIEKHVQADDQGSPKNSDCFEKWGVREKVSYLPISCIWRVLDKLKCCSGCRVASYAAPFLWWIWRRTKVPGLWRF